MRIKFTTNSATITDFISKVGIYGKVDSNIFCKSNKESHIISLRKSKSRVIKTIIESILNIGSHKQQCLALNNILSHPKLVNQVTDYD